MQNLTKAAWIGVSLILFVLAVLFLLFFSTFGIGGYSTSRILSIGRASIVSDSFTSALVRIDNTENVLSVHSMNGNNNIGVVTYYTKKDLLESAEKVKEQYPQAETILEFLANNDSKYRYTAESVIYKNHFNKDLLAVQGNTIYLFRGDKEQLTVALPDAQNSRQAADCAWITKNSLLCETLTTPAIQRYYEISTDSGSFNLIKETDFDSTLNEYVFMTNEYSSYALGTYRGPYQQNRKVDVYRASDMSLVRTEDGNYVHGCSWYGPRHTICGNGNPSDFVLYNIESGEKRTVTVPQDIVESSGFARYYFHPAIPVVLVRECVLPWSVYETTGCERVKISFADFNSSSSVVGEINGSMVNKDYRVDSVDNLFILSTESEQPGLVRFENRYTIDTDYFFNKNK